MKKLLHVYIMTLATLVVLAGHVHADDRSDIEGAVNRFFSSLSQGDHESAWKMISLNINFSKTKLDSEIQNEIQRFEGHFGSPGFWSLLMIPSNVAGVKQTEPRKAGIPFAGMENVTLEELKIYDQEAPDQSNPGKAIRWKEAKGKFRINYKANSGPYYIDDSSQVNAVIQGVLSGDHPLVTGGGKNVLGGKPIRFLKPIKTARSFSGYVLLRYYEPDYGKRWVIHHFPIGPSTEMMSRNIPKEYYWTTTDFEWTEIDVGAAQAQAQMASVPALSEERAKVGVEAAYKGLGGGSLVRNKVFSEVQSLSMNRQSPTQYIVDAVILWKCEGWICPNDTGTEERQVTFSHEDGQWNATAINFDPKYEQLKAIPAH